MNELNTGFQYNRSTDARFNTWRAFYLILAKSRYKVYSKMVIHHRDIGSEAMHSKHPPIESWSFYVNWPVN